MINKEQAEKIVKTMQGLWVSEKANLEKEIAKIVKPMYDSYEANTKKSALYGINTTIKIFKMDDPAWFKINPNANVLSLFISIGSGGAWLTLNDKMKLSFSDGNIYEILLYVGGLRINTDGCTGEISQIERYVYSSFLQHPDLLIRLKHQLPEFFKDAMYQFLEFFNAVSEQAEKIVQATIDAENKSDSMLLAEFGLESETKESVHFPRYKVVEVKEKKGK